MVITVITVIIVLTIMFITYITYKITRPAEDFASRREKTTSILRWFAANPNPRYIDYRRDISADVVEYEDMIALKNNNQLTPAVISAHLH